MRGVQVKSAIARLESGAGKIFLPALLHACNSFEKDKDMKDSNRLQIPEPPERYDLVGLLKLARAVREYDPRREKTQKNPSRRRGTEKPC